MRTYHFPFATVQSTVTLTGTGQHVPEQEKTLRIIVAAVVVIPDADVIFGSG